MNKLLNCQNEATITETEKGGYEMKIYQNGSTQEIVYSDKNCTQKLGYLHPREKAECYGVVDNKAIVVYNVDHTNNKKVGFVRWLGGIE